MIGHHARFRENDIYLFGEVQPQRKSRHFLINAPALIMRKIMRSRDAQCNTGE